MSHPELMKSVADNTYDLEAYTDFCESVWITKDPDCNPIGLNKSTQVMTLGLIGEVGEVMEYIKKYVRDGTVDAELLKKEFGDVLYYWCMLVRRFGYTSTEVIDANVEKLTGRIERGTQRGSGDNR